MNKQEILKIFHDSVAGTPVGYKSLYECDCPFLHRDLGFRDQFKELVLDDIKTNHQPTEPLVYVCQGPGGFLWDFYMVNSLIGAGYHKLTLVFIEPLYEKNIAILQAYLDFQAWCMALTAVYSPKITLTPHLFKSFGEYEQACSKTPQLRGTIFITVDPDDKKTVPDFDKISFVKRFSTIFKKTMRPEAFFYYLYFQKVGANPYRHILTGRWFLKQKHSIIAYNHIYGEKHPLKTTHRRLFVDSKEANLNEI